MNLSTKMKIQNTELRDRPKKPDLVQEIKRERFGWLGNLVRMEEDDVHNKSKWQRRDGRHRIRRHGNVQGDLTYVVVRSVGQELPRGRRLPQRGQGPVQAMKPQTNDLNV